MARPSGILIQSMIKYLISSIHAYAVYAAKDAGVKDKSRAGRVGRQKTRAAQTAVFAFVKKCRHGDTLWEEIR